MESRNRLDRGLVIQRQQTEAELQNPQREIFTTDPVQLTVAAQTIFTVPSQTFYHVNRIIIANITASSETFTLYFIPSGGTASTTNIIHNEISLAADSTWVSESWAYVFPAGGTLQALASTNTALNIQTSGHSIFNGDLL